MGPHRSRRREKQFFIENAALAMAMFDRNMCYLAASKRWLLDYRLVYEEILGRCHYDIFPYIPDQCKAAHQRGMDGSLEHSEEDCIYHADGTIQWARWDLRPWRENDDSIGGIIIFSEDITTQKQTLKKLKTSEEKYKSLFENLSEGFALYEIIPDAIGVGTDLRFLEMNHAFEQLTGLDRSELIGRCISELDYNGETAWIQRCGKVGLTGKSDHFDEYNPSLNKWFEVFAYSPRPFRCAVILTDITQRKQAEEELLNSKTLLQTLVRTIPDLVWLKDPEGKYLFCNSRFEQFYGATEEEIRGKTDFDFVDHSLAEFFRSHDQKAMVKGGPSINEEEIVFSDDGHSEILETIKTPMSTPDGRLLGILGIGRDITERKRAEKELRYQEWLLNQMGKLAQIGGWEYDPATGEGTWTREVAAIHDLDPALPTNRDYGMQFFQGESLEKLRKAISEAEENGKPYDLELELISAKGVRKWVRSIGVPQIKNGRVQRINGSIQDITSFKNDREQIQQLNNLLQAVRTVNQLIVHEKEPKILIEKCCRQIVKTGGCATAMFILTDDDGNPSFWTRTGLNDTSRFMDQMLAKNELPPCCTCENAQADMTFIDEEKNLCRECPLVNKVCYPGKEQFICVKMEYGEKTYGYLVFSITDSRSFVEEDLCLFNEMAGDLAYALNMLEINAAHRVSEEKRQSLEAQLYQSQKMESIGRLAGGVAHDYNNMLSVILGYSEILLEQVQPGDALYEEIQEIVSAAQRSTDITGQLLAFARKQAIAPKVLDLNDTVESMLKMLRRLIGEDIDLSWNPGQTLYPVKMDPVQIDQILVNLCVNARDAISGIGRITIETSVRNFDKSYCEDHEGFLPGDFVMLAITDNGRGIAKKDIEYIFEPFFSTKKVGQGTGLGLATVYGIVKQNNGFINVYSELENGTTFKIYLPECKGNGSTHSRNETDDITMGSGETILVVEDEPLMLSIAEKMLIKLGYNVLLAKSPAEAMAVAEQHHENIALLLTDVIMPEMNGKELHGKMKGLYPDLKYLFMSGYTADVIAHHEILEEGLHFIQKPFLKKELAKQVRKALKSETA